MCLSFFCVTSVSDIRQLLITAGLCWTCFLLGLEIFQSTCNQSPLDTVVLITCFFWTSLHLCYHLTVRLLFKFPLVLSPLPFSQLAIFVTLGFTLTPAKYMIPPPGSTTGNDFCLYYSTHPTLCCLLLLADCSLLGAGKVSHSSSHARQLQWSLTPLCEFTKNWHL